MTGRPTAASGFPWTTHRTVAEKTCTTCDKLLGRKNKSGLCLKHRYNSKVVMPTNFAVIAEGKYAAQLAAELGVHVDTIRNWAYHIDLQLAPAPRTRARPTIVASQSAAPSKSWCSQCERRVSFAEASNCRSQWCKVGFAA